ncbi:hypothetical protein [Kitasatospora sp. NBC_01266]|nr:hypothetical protein [Kitasatospora sp. NBC_01266]
MDQPVTVAVDGSAADRPTGRPPTGPRARQRDVCPAEKQVESMLEF